MSIQYLSNDKGDITAVQLPIEEWKKIKSIYPDIESAHFTLPEWQIEVLDKRLDAISKTPSRVKPISELINELDK